MSVVEFDQAVVAPHDVIMRAPATVRPVLSDERIRIGPSSRLSHTIDLRQNRTVVTVTALSVAVVLALFAGLWLGRFSKTETTRGIVGSTHGFSRLDAPRAGFIKKIYVAQGERVDAGTPLYLLGIGEPSSGGDSALASEMKTLLQSRNTNKEEIDRAAKFIANAHEQQKAMVKDQNELNSALDNQEKSVQEALEQSRQKLQRVKELVKQGYATREIQDSYERTYFEYEHQYTDIKLKRVEYKRQASDKERDLAVLIGDKQSQQANATTQIDSIDARVGHLKTESVLQIQAQSPGQVLAISGKVGDSVEAGQFVAAVGDVNAEPLIILDVPARATGLVKIGQTVVLKYDAFPFKTFGIQHGTITSISSAAVRAPATEGDTGLDPRPVSRQSLYRIEVRPDSDEIEAYGEKKKITLGSTLSADIIVERRRLIDWVLDPIRAMRGRT